MLCCKLRGQGGLVDRLFLFDFCDGWFKGVGDGGGGEK